METEIKIFISYLHNIKRMSGNTVVSYERDLEENAAVFSGSTSDYQGTGYHGNQSEFLYVVSGKESFCSVYSIEKRSFHACDFSSICIRSIS